MRHGEPPPKPAESLYKDYPIEAWDGSDNRIGEVSMGDVALLRWNPGHIAFDWGQRFSIKARRGMNKWLDVYDLGGAIMTWQGFHLLYMFELGVLLSFDGYQKMTVDRVEGRAISRSGTKWPMPLFDREAFLRGEAARKKKEYWGKEQD